MKIAVLGRTRWLLDTGRALMAAGHDIVAVATAKSEPFYGCGPEDFASLASDAGAVGFGVVSLSDVAVRERLRACGAKLAVSINWPTIVGADVIGLFPRGVVNAHCGDLPRYRGNACPNWAILNDEPRIGLCAHMMEPNEVDAGAVILRDYFPVSTDTYIGDVYAWLNQRVPALLVEAIEGLDAGRLVPQAQPTDPSLGPRGAVRAGCALRRASAAATSAPAEPAASADDDVIDLREPDEADSSDVVYLPPPAPDHDDDTHPNRPKWSGYTLDKPRSHLSSVDRLADEG